MKNRSRVLAQVVLLLFVFLGCSEDAPQSSSAAKAVLDADPASTILEIFGEPDRFVRTEKLISVLRAIPADQTHAFEEALNGLDFPNRELDRVLVITAWAKHDAAAATKWAKNKERVDIVRNAMFAESVYAWALVDHESFLSDMEMALYLLPGIDASILRALIKGWFDSGGKNLEAYIRDMTPQSMDRQRAVDTLVKIKTARDGAAAMIEWAKALRGDRYYKASVYSRVAAAVVLIDSKRVLDWCAEICDSELGKEMPHMIAAAWVAQSGEEAMDFIASQPNAVGVRTGARAAYRRFLKADPDRAFAWIETLTEEQRRGPVMQGPIGMYVNRRSALGYPLQAIEWLDYLQEETDRESGTITIMRRWLRTDESAAEAWMAQSSMSEEAKLDAHQNHGPKSSRKRRS